MIALQDQTRGRAWREKREIVQIGWRRDGDEALDFRSPHQQLHADPGAERKTGDPARAGVLIIRLHPIKGRSRIGKLALAPVEATLTASDAAEIEPQGREAAAHKTLIQGVHHLIVHRAAMLRMRVQN